MLFRIWGQSICYVCCAGSQQNTYNNVHNHLSYVTLSSGAALEMMIMWPIRTDLIGEMHLQHLHSWEELIQAGQLRVSIKIKKIFIHGL